MLRMNAVVMALAISIASLSPSLSAEQDAQQKNADDIAATGGAAAFFTGEVIILQEVTATEDNPDGKHGLPNQEVNVDGLVVVQVKDTQSSPTVFPHLVIEPADAFKRLGRLRGVRANDHGQLMIDGGGFTWAMLKPIKACEASITVTYTPNGGDRKAVVRTHKVKVVAKK